MKNILSTLVTTFKNGNLATKLSFILMGARNFSGKQVTKALAFFVSELAFIYFMIVNGVSSIISMITLGTQSQGWAFDEELGFRVRVAGENSMLLLIYGIVTVFIIIAFFMIWYLNIKSAANLDRLKADHKAAPTLVDEVHDFLDGRFHFTLLTIPTASIVIFTVLPLIYMISIAFTSYDHNHLPPKNLFDWVGFSNFTNIITGNLSDTFLPVLSWTIIWATFATFTCFFFGVVLALLLHSKGVLGKKVLRSLFVITMAVPPFISLLVMRNLLHSSGPINAMLMNWAWISEPLPFLTDGLWAKVSVIVVNMWIGIPASMLITTAVIINLPEDQLEAARIDGANPFHIFRFITFPQILTVMAPTLIQQFVLNINNFNVIYLLTGGLPTNSKYYGAGETDLLVTWLYKLTVDNADYNLASVIGLITFALSAGLSVFVYTRTNSYKEGAN